MSSAIEHDREFWERHAQHDPLWAILSDPTRKGRKWDLEGFFATGAREISLVLYQLDRLHPGLPRGSALDFGCGIGRLTQALATYFEQAAGVDISPTMIRLAGKLNRYPDRVGYVVNSREDLRVFGDHAFDFIYSDIVLQHLEPPLALRYLAEFFRVLRIGGALVFQLPSHLRPAGDQAPAIRPMPEDAYRARLIVDGPPAAAAAGSDMTLMGSITNESPHEWSQREFGSIRVGNHWLDRNSAAMLIQDDGRASISGTLRPGETIRFVLGVTAPAGAGDYQCEVDLVHEGISWFADKGSRPSRFVVGVGDASIDPSQPHSQKSADGTPPAVDFRDTDVYSELPALTEDPGDFPMHGIHRDTILELIASHGARLLHVEEDERCGKEWVGYRYFVSASR
jgi:SAM-dependent methyltransferase